MAHETHLKNNKYRQWVKACLGLRYLHEGLAPFCDDIGRQQHKDMLNQIQKSKTPQPNVPCVVCQIETLQPNHARLGKRICPLNQNNCNCCSPHNKRPCPNNVCGAIYDEIIQNHALTPPVPFWKNSDAQQWSTDPWSVCKCFINSPRYKHTTSAVDTDITGLLHVIINNKYFHSHIGCNVVGPNSLFYKVRQYRNDILHSSSMELEEPEANTYIDGMISVLQDGKELVHRQDAQQAVLKLQELKQNDLIITTEDFGEILRQMKTEMTQILKFTESVTDKDEHRMEELKKQLETQIFKIKEKMNMFNGKHTKDDQTVYKTPMLDEEIHESIDKLSKHIFLELNEYDETVHDMRALVQASSSVCKLVQGNLCATGFRVGSKYIMTSAHVADQIQEGMKSGIGPQAVFNYFKCDIPDKEDLFDIEKIVYTNTELDISVMELGKSSHPFPCPFKDFCQFSSNRVFHFVGHAEGNIMKIDHIKKIVNTTDPKVFESLAKLRKHSNDYTSDCHFDTPPYDTLENPHRVLFQCKFSHCGGGSPGIVLINGIVVVTTVLLRGYPEWYYDSLRKDYKKNWKLENCVQQGVNLASVHEKMGQTHQGLCQDIFGSSMVHVFSSPDKDEWVSDGEGWESDDIYKIDKSDKQLKPKTSKKRKSKAHVEHKRSMKRKDKVKRVSDDDGWESDDSCKFDRSSNNALKSKPWKKHKSKACVKTKRLFKRRGLFKNDLFCLR